MLLEEQGPNRYFESNLRVMGEELLLLDSCVWHIRVFCVPVDGYAKIGEKVIWTSKEHFEKVQNFAVKDNPGRIYLPFGRLEEILASKSENRRDLIWKNFFFERHRKKSIRWPSKTRIASPTHVCHPDIFKELAGLVKFSSKAKEYFNGKT